MFKTITTKEAAAYFAQGFVPCKKVAARHALDLHDAIISGSDEAEYSFIDVLTQVINDIDKSKLNIALTAGHDSRALLAVSTELSPKKTVECFTWGKNNSDDVKGARRAARGMRHLVLDSTNISWDFEEVVSRLAGIRSHIGDSLPRVDGIWMIDNLERSIGEDSARLSGFLGDMLSGAHLTGDFHNDPAKHLQNINLTGVPNKFDAAGCYREFLEKERKLIKSITDNSELTVFDIIDLSFRQRQRIQPAISGTSSLWNAPMADMRYILKWSKTPLSSRLNQVFYKRKLKQKFPRIFSTKDALLHRRDKAFRKLKGRFDGKGAEMRNFADPGKNQSLNEFLLLATSRFDQRKLVDINTLTSARSLTENPSAQAWTLAMLASSLEVYLTCADA